MKLQDKPQNKLSKKASRPYKDLYIYYLQGRLKPAKEIFQENFIGNWQEDNYSFLFFSSPARPDVEALLRTQPQLAYLDTFHMSYDQWQSEMFTTIRHGIFRIQPAWEASAERNSSCDDELTIFLDPGVVFGNGTHPTTSDCLKALELAAATRTIETVLDLGTGTGLLALAAARLGCRKILAIDLNLLAAKTAKNNVCLNELGDKVLVAQGRAEDFIDCPADLVFANIHYDVMQNLIRSEGFLHKRRFVLSGLLRSEAKAVANMLAQLPVKVIKTWTHEGIWHTFYGKRC
jgi:ribosomal protein L11 methyltransferase